MFSLNTLHQINAIDIQRDFKKWYNQTFPHMCGLRQFREFLDKSRIKSNWGQCLSLIGNVHQYAMVNKKMKQTRAHLINYATNDCLAVTKLTMVVELNWTKEQLQRFNQL